MFTLRQAGVLTWTVAREREQVSKLVGNLLGIEINAWSMPSDEKMIKPFSSTEIAAYAVELPSHLKRAESTAYSIG
jgi:hypothetical protein